MIKLIANLMSAFLLSIFVSLYIYMLVSTQVYAAYNQGQTQLLKVGEGESYTTIQGAIDASVKYQQVVIFIKAGVYQEKLFITRNNLALVGESADKTIIQFSELRNNWREKHTNDWGAAVVNINATDIVLANLSIINDYGIKTGDHEHQFAVRGFELSDRIITHNCKIIAGGADTLSLWNKHGRYYHSNCYFEGHTDMVCPRGTALIEHSQFFNQKQSATIWHDGELNPEHKLVVNNSQFDGIPGFWLGRHHYDAQFYLLNSQFSKHMADKPIFKKRYNNKGRERANLYGSRYFFEGNSSENTYPWLESNFRLSDVIPAQAPDLETWVFKGDWSPSTTLNELEVFLKAQANPLLFTAFSHY
ncbi:pectinesterase family protein [Paraglaciecola aquimarina]|uniref:Pectinesterase family protein n=1 Tax=Paraglaciecola algarum TaxID=3050085 RepID=A0ABS9D9V3_9ALTE|nr:pectinesterase family protein [Paraglaciecola sp. G1-23]MCF2949585.1 pectinesterase family protein [Paraglaciecola sp. G1-23]